MQVYLQLPRREQYICPTGQISQKPRAMQVYLQLPRHEQYICPTGQISQKPSAEQIFSYYLCFSGFDEKPAQRDMPDTIIYISVILPLRLEWEPCYWTDCPDIAAGQRVKVQFAHKEYTGVVSAVGIEPQTAPSRIMQITGIEEKMGRILPTEIEFWRYLAGYYMCSVGEVYKTAYPSAKINMEEKFLKDSFERSGNECLVMGNREYTFIYDKYASSQEEYENTKCQLSTSDFLFLFEEWIEKKKELTKWR